MTTTTITGKNPYLPEIIEDDPLPQPYRFINKVVMRCFDSAMQRVSDAEHGRAPVVKSYKNPIGIKTSTPTNAADPYLLPDDVTCHVMHGKELLMGKEDGSVESYNVLTHSTSFVTAPLDAVKGGPIVHLRAIQNVEGYSTYVAAGQTGVVVFGFPPVDTAVTLRRGSVSSAHSTATQQPPISNNNVNDAGDNNDAAPQQQLTVFATIAYPAGVADPAHDVVSLDVSVEGRYVAVGLKQPALQVAVYEVPHEVPTKVYVLRPGAEKPTPPNVTSPLHTIACPELVSSPTGHQNTAAPTTPRQQQQQQQPTPSQNPPPTLTPFCAMKNVDVRPKVFFVHHDPPVPLGHPSDLLRQHEHTHAVYIGWLGSTCMSSMTLIPSCPDVQKNVHERASLIRLQKQQHRRPDTDGPPTTAGGKGAKDKGGKQAAPVVTTTFDPYLPRFDDVTGSLRHITLPHYLCCCSASESSSKLIALAMAEGIVWVWDTVSCRVQATVHLAQHRTRWMARRAMLATYVGIYRDQYVFVSNAALGSEYATTWVVADASTGDIVSRTRYATDTVDALVHPSLSSVVCHSADGEMRVIDLASGTAVVLLAPRPDSRRDRVESVLEDTATSRKSGAASTTDTAAGAPATSLSADGPVVRTYNMRFADLHASQKHRDGDDSRREFSFYDDVIVVITGRTLHTYSAIAAFSTAYPKLGPSIFGMDQLVGIVNTKPHAERDDPSAAGALNYGSVSLVPPSKPMTTTATQRGSRRPSRRPSQVSSFAGTHHSAATGQAPPTLEATSLGLRGVPAAYSGDPSNVTAYLRHLMDVRDCGRVGREQRLKEKMKAWKCGAP
eukprot:PhM_4_TR12756/c0_g1_i1/m.70452